MKFSAKAILASAALAALAPAALAQLETLTVTGITGDVGSVIVMRGGETYSLQMGNVLLPGDVIMTRSTGTITINNGSTCARSLTGLQSITIGTDFCTTQVASVDTTSAVGGEAAIAGGGTGAAFPVLGALAAAGAAAAAAGGGDDGPSSP